MWTTFVFLCLFAPLLTFSRPAADTRKIALKELWSLLSNAENIRNSHDRQFSRSLGASLPLRQKRVDCATTKFNGLWNFCVGRTRDASDVDVTAGNGNLVARSRTGETHGLDLKDVGELLSQLVKNEGGLDEISRDGSFGQTTGAAPDFKDESMLLLLASLLGDKIQVSSAQSLLGVTAGAEQQEQNATASSLSPKDVIGSGLTAGDERKSDLTDQLVQLLALKVLNNADRV